MYRFVTVLVLSSLFWSIESIPRTQNILETTEKPTPSEPVNGFSAVHDVLRVLPTTKIDEIEKSHLKTDDGFKAAILYLQGEEWKRLVNNAMKTVEFENFAKMALKFKLNVTQAVICIADHIKSIKVVPSKITSKPNLGPFVSDVQKVFPIGPVAAFLASTKDNPQVKRMRQEIGTREHQKIAEDLHNNPNMVKLREVLKGMDFDVEPYIALVYTFLGWVY